MKALVTGGAGFIGSHLVDALVGRGDEVLIVDDLSTGNEENLAGSLGHGAELVRADVTDFDAFDAAVEGADTGGGSGFDAVFHLAAQVDVRISVASPGLDTRTNVEGTVNALELARRGACENFVFASSCAVYGEPDPAQVPLPEGAPTSPLSPYGQGKLASEGYIDLYGRLHGIHGGILRFANVYGPRQGSVGEAGVVAIFNGRLGAGEAPIVFGTGEQTRDFVYVGDVVAGLIAVADRGARGVFNIGTGRETSVLELIESLLTITEADGLNPEMAAARAGEVERMALDPAAAQNELGWSAEVGLDDGLRTTWQARG